MSIEDLCIFKYEVLATTLHPVHFDPNSILMLARKFQPERQAFIFPLDHKVFLEPNKEVVSKMIDTPSSRIDIIDKGLHQEFITWAKEDKYSFSEFYSKYLTTS